MLFRPCGGCRLTVGGQTKFACVDGPDFDGDLVDFDEAMARGTMYRPFEAHAREAACNLPSTIAVLPVPGSPMSTGLFFVRRDRT